MWRTAPNLLGLILFKRLIIFLPVFIFFVLTVTHANSLSVKSKTLKNGARYESSECWFNLTSFPSGFQNLSWASGLKIRRIECGYLFTRKEQGKSFFQLPIVIIRNSLWQNSKKPILYIAGGPGSSSWLSQKDLSDFWLPYIDDIDWQHDFVMFDTRGTGLSKPALHCEHFLENTLAIFSKNLQPEEEAKSYFNIAQNCHQKMSKEQLAAIKQLGTQKSANDIADLADLLNIESWHLYGTSYGTRLALEVERHHPDKVASLILDSVYPLEVDGEETLPGLYLDSLKRIIDACANDSECSAHFPQLGKELQELFKQLQKKPITFTLSVNNKPVKYILTPARLFSVLFDAGYSIESIVVVPNAIHSLYLGVKEPIQFLIQWSLELMRDNEFSNPVFMEVECNENEIKNQRIHVENIIKKYKNYPVLKRWQLAFFTEDICKSWGAKEVNKSFHQALHSDKPALIFAGKLDNVTPSKWGKLLSKDLTNSEYHEFKASAHGVLFDVDCAKEIVRGFLNPEKQPSKNCHSKDIIKWEVPKLLNP